MPRCPECRNGKHSNCTRMALDPDLDTFVPCRCECRKEHTDE